MLVYRTDTLSFTLKLLYVVLVRLERDPSRLGKGNETPSLALVARLDRGGY